MNHLRYLVVSRTTSIFSGAQVFGASFSFENIFYTGTKDSLSTQFNAIILQAFMLFMSLHDQLIQYQSSKKKILKWYCFYAAIDVTIVVWANDSYMFLKTPSCLLTCTIYFRSLDTTLFAQNNMNNIYSSPGQISLGSPCFTADATASLLSVQMNNLGITNATALQPETSHVQKFPELQRVHDVENSHGVSHDRPAPTSPQSNSMVRSIDRPKQTTDVSRRGTEKRACTNFTDLTSKQLEPELVGASASNYEVKDEYSVWCIRAILRCSSVRNALLCVIKENKLLVHGQTTSYKQ